MANTINVDYPSNSKKPRVRPEEPRRTPQEQIATGTARKKRGAQRLSDIFLAEDVSEVIDYVVAEVLIPSAKKTLLAMVQNGFEALIYGRSSADCEPHRTNAGRVSYRRYYDDGNSNRPRRDMTGRMWREDEPARRRTPYDEIVLETKQDAVDVMRRMNELLCDYEKVRVADLYDLVGITCDFTHEKFGWLDLSGSKIVRVSDGYVLDLPKPVPID